MLINNDSSSSVYDTLHLCSKWTVNKDSLNDKSVLKKVVNFVKEMFNTQTSVQ